MSSAGFTVYNDNGNLVIDSELKNLSLRYKGYVISSQGDPVPSVDGVNLDYRRVFRVRINVRNPVIAIRPDLSADVPPIQREWRKADNIAMVSRLDPLGGDLYDVYFFYCGSFTYYVFDDPQPGSDVEKSGLQVWNSQGELCFSSAFQYMRVMGSFVGSFDYGGPYHSVNHVPEPAGRSYALVQSRCHMLTTQLGEPVNHQMYGLLDFYSYVVRSSGLGIGVVLASTHFGGYYYYNGTVLHGVNTLLHGSSLIIDVTGY